MACQQVLQKLQEHPKKLFLIDGVGALLSAFLLGVVLVKFEAFFGIPRRTLYLLAVLPCFFALYDLLSYGLLRKVNQVGKFLIGIAVSNTAYCLLSLGLAILHRNEITIWGWSYLIIEMMIVILLARFELRIGKRLRSVKDELPVG